MPGRKGIEEILGIELKKENIIGVELIPLTWIVAPYVTEEQLKAWREKGWIDNEGLFLDRAFPRDYLGRPFIFRFWLESPMVRAARLLNMDSKIGRDWRIIDIINLERLEVVPTDYIIIPRKPLRYRRVVFSGKSTTTQFFEYIDSTFSLRFNVLASKPADFRRVMIKAGEIGMMAMSKHGYGRFTVKFIEPFTRGEVEEEKEKPVHKNGGRDK